MAPIDSSSAFVEVWLNGLYSALALQALSMIVRSTRTSTPQKMLQSGIIIAPYICSTVHMSSIWVLTRNAINDNEIPTAGSSVLWSLTHPSAWGTALGVGAFGLNTWIADGIVIWRCWKVWGRRWVIVIMQILCWIAGAGLGLVILVTQVKARSTDESMNASESTPQFVALSAAFFSMSIATSVTTAVLIAARIISVQRETRNTGIRTGDTYNSVVEVVVESAALYSVTLLTFLIVLTKHDTGTTADYAERIHAQIAGMAPMMIVYRIVAKQARPDADWVTTPAVSVVQFASIRRESVIGQGSTGTHDNGNSTLIVIPSKGASTIQEKFTSVGSDV